MRSWKVYYKANKDVCYREMTGASLEKVLFDAKFNLDRAKRNLANKANVELIAVCAMNYGVKRDIYVDDPNLVYTYYDRSKSETIEIIKDIVEVDENFDLYDIFDDVVEKNYPDSKNWHPLAISLPGFTCRKDECEVYHHIDDRDFVYNFGSEY